MNWSKFNTYGESRNHAFEVMCNIVFEAWCKEEYGDRLIHFFFINGNGGDGGVEAYAVVDDNTIVAIQSKWFPNKLTASQINQIYNSFSTAIRVRSQIRKYIVCLPRDLNSTKVVKGKRLATNTEEKRWNDLVEKCRKLAPEVEIELWTETRLQEKLTHDRMRGIHKYWFDNSELLDSQFELSFKKAINGWASIKYIPDIYTEGHIHNQLASFLGSHDLTRTRCNYLRSLLNKMVSLESAYKELLSFGLPDNESVLKEKIDNDLNLLQEWISLLEMEESFVKAGNEIDFPKSFCLCCTIDDFKEKRILLKNYFHFHDVETVLETIEEEFFSFQRLFKNRNDNRLIILGDPGCGKTTAIVSEAASFLKDNSHLPILIHARDFSTGDVWNTIIEKTLGLSSNWNEDELFKALETAALLRNKHDDSIYGIIPKCIICVDGIDEAASYSFWRNRIEEAVAYSVLFPRVRFVFLTRPYAFNDWTDLQYHNCIRWIPKNGDVEPEQLCDAYFKKYNISVGKSSWIKTFLRTPLSLKLFCELYQNSSVENIDKNTTVITRLFKKRIEKLEIDFSQSMNYIASNSIINNTLCEMATLFIEREELTQRDIEQVLCGYDSNELKRALCFLEREGFIYSRKHQKNELSPVILVYSCGLQPVYDYLIAHTLYLKLRENESVRTEYSQGVFQMLGIIAIENDGKLLFDYPSIQVDNNTMFELICYVMANASAKATEKYRDYMMKMMKQSAFAFHEIANNVVFSVCKIDNHPLGASILDCFLRSFDSPADRDIWWSIPAYLKGHHTATWTCGSELRFDDIQLSTNDMEFAAPLVLAWSLSNVNNDVRSKSRKKLIRWGLVNSDRFLRLLAYMSDVDDEQLLEDLFSVAYGIALGKYSDKKYLYDASSWILDCIFSETGLRKYSNIAIRYFSAGIVKIAIAEGLLDDAVKSTIIPPFSYQPKLLELEKDALRARRMSGYSSIVYDLARYVLCDQLDYFFRHNSQSRKYSEQAEHLINEYRDKYNLIDVNQDGLIISMAYKYLKNQGWSEHVFLSNDKHNYVGIDSAIRHTYYAATHGDMSRVMSVTEKYIWIFRHKVKAMLSDRIPITELYYSSAKHFVHDYLEIESFTNPYQDYVNNIYRTKDEKWHNIDTLAVLDSKSLNADIIQRWMKKEDIPDFESWIMANSCFVLLDTFTNVVNKAAGVEETIWVGSGVVKNYQLEAFIESFDYYFEEREELSSGRNLRAFHKCNGFRTPQEICMIHADTEVESSITIVYNDQEIIINKLVSSCLVSDEIDTEKSFSVPSRFLRELIGISYGNGYEYLDKGGQEIAKYHDIGENWGTQQQAFFIDKSKFLDGLSNNRYTPFWIFRIYRSPSNKAYERFRNILHDTDNTYLVWLEDERLTHKKLVDLELPLRPEQLGVEKTELTSILEKYKIKEDE